ncbi:MAG TPA: phosphotriesterase-related protein [Candidatus Bathyarchaeia archaeon]|nr:phosphotriesterase-related protein [Candidatus Bathyarchaeia archaeon]
MTEVQSVSGAVASDALGFVLAHEHVACASAGIVRSWPSLFGGRPRLVETGIRALAEAREAGVTTIVDATTFDLGRDIELLAEVARGSGVTILASTGHWLMPSPTMLARSVEQLADLFIRDLSEGADGTSIRAAVIKVASEESVLPFEERVLQAAALANKATGAPILTHAAARNRIGDAQADVLEAAGVDPSRVVIGHSDDGTDIGYLTGLLRRGFRIGMDRLPNGAMPEYGPQSVDDRIFMIVRLVDAGYADRLVLAHDDPIWAGLLTEVDQARHVEANPDRLAFVSRRVLPELRRRGVGDEAIHEMTVTSPRAWLTGVQ